MEKDEHVVDWLSRSRPDVGNDAEATGYNKGLHDCARALAGGITLQELADIYERGGTVEVSVCFWIHGKVVHSTPLGDNLTAKTLFDRYMARRRTPFPFHSVEYGPHTLSARQPKWTPPVSGWRQHTWSVDGLHCTVCGYDIGRVGEAIPFVCDPARGTRKVREI